MKREITRYALLNSMEILNKFSFVKGDLGLAVARTKASMEEQFLIFQDERNAITEKYGVQDENGEYQVDENSENYKEYMKETFECVDKFVEVEIFTVPRAVFYNEDIFNPDCSAVDYEIFAKLMIDRE